MRFDIKDKNEPIPRFISKSTTLEGKVLDIISSFAGVDREKLDLNTNLTDIISDSLEILELKMILEEDFDLNPAELDKQKFDTVKSIVVFLEKTLAT